MTSETYDVEVEVGFKTYLEGTGDAALKLAKLCSRLAIECDVKLILTVQPTDIYRISRGVLTPVITQHVDAIRPGRHTGWLLPEAAKAAGAVGSFLNHCEKPLTMNQIKKTIERLHELDMISLVSARDIESIKEIALFNPDIIMVEPPELVGTGKAVTQVKPEIVTNAVKEIRKIDSDIRVLCGAGISSREDVKKAIELGADGVGITSFVLLANDQEAAMRDILEGVTMVH